ncbi:kinase-like protein [Rhizopogon vinicolor AM-OR11-026]|uniref:Kinase-like protein n=1 Tax=Rhizopogon vinicolor AM-OR11-026 TaxID=1314800 RepID=A0A1B7MYH9_9AGAM|nr:kinase-like protein [Rhizopogon vinicolor AM-OR11-026]
MGVWKRMRHKHIVPFFGVANNFVPSRISLVSPWQSDGTLTSLLERKHDMNCKERLPLLEDIANGLCYLHSVNVVHGDLTGFNVLIDADGHARLTDFGLSSVVNASEGLAYLAVTTRRPGALRWVAPELVVKDNAHIAPTFESDIYSFGSVMLQTLSGRLPWSEIKNLHFIIIKLYEECLPQRPESLPILDAHWDFIMLCMNLVIESRPVAVEVVKWVKEAISSWNGSIGTEAKKLSPLPSLHHRTLLNNFLQARYSASAGDRVRWEICAMGIPHAPTWCAVVYIDDIRYGEGESSTRSGAMDTAARHAMENLNREGNVVAS